MSRQAVNRVLELAPSLDLSHFEFRVLVYLADRLNAKTGQLNPSPERLARDCGLADPEKAERNVRRVVDRLAAKGLVERIGSSAGGRQPGGRYPKRGYRLHLDAVRVVLMTGEGGPHDHPKGGPHDPRTKEVDLEPGKGNLTSGSTTRPAARASRSGGRAKSTTLSASPTSTPTTLAVEPDPPSRVGPERESSPRTDADRPGIRPTILGSPQPPTRPLSAVQAEAEEARRARLLAELDRWEVEHPTEVAS